MKNKIGIIIGREFNERIRKKSFIITTLLTPLLMIALMAAPTLIMSYSGGDSKRIAVIDDSGLVASHLQSNDEAVFESVPLTIETARKELTGHFAILHIGKNIMSNPNEVWLYNNSPTSFGLESNITKQIESVIENEKLKSYNIENLPQILAAISTKVSMKSFKNDDTQSDDDSNPQSSETKSQSSIVATVIAYVLSFLLYMFLLIYGVMVMQSVIEEKSNRVLEVLVSSVRPFDLMLGKIFGVALVAVVQITIWIVLIAGVGYFVIPALLPDDIVAALHMMQQGIDSPTQDVDNIRMLQALATLTDIGYLVKIFASLLLFMVGGFLLYAAMFAAVGASVDNPQDAQQLQTPIIMPIILALLIMLTVIKDPTSNLAFWFSMIPLTSPIVMMARIPYDIPTWEIIVSLGLLIITFVIVVWFASKIYRVGILMHGKKPTIKELWRWMRYK